MKTEQLIPVPPPVPPPVPESIRVIKNLRESNKTRQKEFQQEVLKMSNDQLMLEICRLKKHEDEVLIFACHYGFFSEYLTYFPQ